MRVRPSCLLLLCLPGLVGSLAGHPAVAVANESVTLAPVADVEASMQFPNTNLGNAPSASVRPHTFEPDSDIFLRFDLASIPEGATVLEATLTMTAFEGWAFGGDGTVYVQFVTSDTWTESVLTWHNQPATSGEVLGTWWLWYDGTPVNQIGQTNTAALAQRVQTEALGDGMLSVRLSSPGYRTVYRTREYSNAAQRPSLQVVYSETSGVVAPGTAGGLRLECVPTPLRNQGVLNFAIPVSGTVSMEILDVSGRSVATLLDGPFSAGAHAAPWDRRTTSGARAPAGVYFARLSVDGHSVSRRVVVVD